MAQYVGFSTKDACKPKTTNAVGGIDNGVGGIRQPIVWGKKYRLVDTQLVVQDFLNALNITLGSKVGQNEIFRVARTDPRIILNSVKAFPKENGILLEVELAINPFNQPELVSVFFNRATNTATFI